MSHKSILLSVTIVAVAVGFVLYSSPYFAEEVNLANGAQYEESAAASGDEYSVPADILYTEPVKTVAFSHETHAVKLEYKCDTCHTAIFEMQARTVQDQPDFNMQGLADGKYCGSCHSSEHEVAFSTSDQCARCHIGVTGLEAELVMETDGNVTGTEADSGDTGDQAGNG